MTATNPDVKRIVDALVKKTPIYTAAFAYYDGDQPLKYSTERIREAFSDLSVYFAQNWVSVVIDSVLDRLVLKGFDASTSDTDDDLLNELFTSLRLQQESDEAHESALITGEGFILVGQRDDGTPEAYYNDPRLCHVFYSNDNPNLIDVAGKMWADLRVKRRYLNLYYADRIEHYTAPGADLTASSSFQFIDGDGAVETWKFSRPPVFHFRRGRRIRPELTRSDYSLQDAVNKLLSDLMVTSEFSAFRQRIIISQSDPGQLKNAPNRNWWIPAGDGIGQGASVAEIGGADNMEGFLKTMDQLANSLAIITRTPKHYFFNTGSDPSGDALTAMEAPLIKKTTRYQEAFSVTWKELISFVLELQGVSLPDADITPTWDTVETVQKATQADVIKVLVDAGVPLLTAARRMGWPKDEITQLEKDLKEAKQQQSSIAKEVLAGLKAKDAQDNTPLTNKGEETDAADSGTAT